MTNPLAEALAKHLGDLQSVEAGAVRDLPIEQMQKWIAEDERDAADFWQWAASRNFLNSGAGLSKAESR